MKIFAIVLVALGLYVCVMNYVSVAVSLRNKKRGIDHWVSPVPFLAGIFMFVSAIILLPKNIWALAFLAFLLDHTYPMFIRFLITLITRKNKL